MDTVKRRREDCPACENRGLIYVGGDDADFPCPYCNGWCTGCLEKPLDPRLTRPFLGSLFAAVQRFRGGLRLLEGYLCDFHKGRFNSYSIIAPGMIGRFAAGAPYIVGSSCVMLYGIGEAANVEELAADARQATATQRCFPSRPWDCYVCPPDLAARVVPPEWVRWQLGEVLERSMFSSGARVTTWVITEGTSAARATA
jgi:hypothetical protein